MVLTRSCQNLSSCLCANATLSPVTAPVLIKIYFFFLKGVGLFYILKCHWHEVSQVYQELVGKSSGTLFVSEYSLMLREGRSADIGAQIQLTHCKNVQMRHCKNKHR